MIFESPILFHFVPFRTNLIHFLTNSPIRVNLFQTSRALVWLFSTFLCFVVPILTTSALPGVINLHTDIDSPT